MSPVRREEQRRVCSWAKSTRSQHTSWALPYLFVFHIFFIFPGRSYFWGRAMCLAACSIGHSSERIGNVVFRVWLLAVYDIAAGWLLWCVLGKRKRKFQKVHWTWFSSRTVMLRDEWHVCFGFIHVVLSILSMLMVDLLYTKRMTEKKTVVFGSVWPPS